MSIIYAKFLKNFFTQAKFCFSICFFCHEKLAPTYLFVIKNEKTGQICPAREIYDQLSFNLVFLPSADTLFSASSLARA